MADGPRTRAAAAGDKDEAKGDAPATPAEAAAEAKVEEDPTIDRDMLLANAEAYFGEPVWHVAAALASLPHNRKNFTVAEVKAAIKAVLATEVS